MLNNLSLPDQESTPYAHSKSEICQTLEIRKLHNKAPTCKINQKIASQSMNLSWPQWLLKARNVLHNGDWEAAELMLIEEETDCRDQKSAGDILLPKYF